MSNIDQSLKTADDGKEERLGVARRYTSSVAQAAYTIAELTDGKTDVVSVAESFIDRMRQLDKGTVESEMLLKTNALTLDALFHKMVKIGYSAPLIETMQATMNLAMRAQNQLRKTLLALEQVRHPAQKTFVTQQNIAQVQQVNNGLIPEAEHGNILKSENKLNNVNEAIHETRPLESSTESCTITQNPRIQDLDGLNRAEDT